MHVARADLVQSAEAADAAMAVLSFHSAGVHACPKLLPRNHVCDFLVQV